MDKMIKEALGFIYEGDKENANKDSSLISTKKELSAGLVSKAGMDRIIPADILERHFDGDIHIHDLDNRLFGSINCCLFDMGRLLEGGFELNGIQYTEPTSVESAMRVLTDVILHASSQQYGGFTVPQIDTVLAKYVKIGIEKSKKFYMRELEETTPKEVIEKLAVKYVTRSLEQGFQALETRQNSINNANGQTTFLTLTFGLDTTEEGRLVSKVLLENRMKGLGKNGATPIFPKLVFLHRYGVNGKEGDINYDLYLKSIECSSKRMYPDYLSLNAGYLGEIYDEYEQAISPMGCRAFLSPYFNEKGEIVYTGRANCGAITINTVRCAIESRGNKEEYFRLIKDRFDLATRVHLATYNQLKNIKASTNPLFFMEGGCHMKLKANETIERAIKTFTWSYGYIGLEEVTQILLGKHLHEDNSLAIETLEYLQELIEEAKEKYNMLFALYSTPAESLCFSFRNKDLKKFGYITDITTKQYYTNSFHVDVREQVNAIQKQIIESPMFEIAKGGRIIYNEFPSVKNLEAMKQMIDYAMANGKYYGINKQLDKCNDCYYSEEFTDPVCPNCGSKNILRINRICGYLGYDNRMNAGKLEEKNNRVDHFGCEL